MNPEKFSTITAALLSSSAASLKQEVLKVATINDLFELANRVEDARICFKASWALEHILLSEKKLLLSYATPSIEAFLKNKQLERPKKHHQTYHGALIAKLPFDPRARGNRL
ncbi:hypothetical protein [Sphingobacterium sp. T2]|uniref:hypothetical protein n=1 Tax=Sphingobacterium sp. T2 TaxID=1590596 RepID=UPI00057BB58E|nr:hypothetical protein [Sphingobacterium sp. T2]